MHASVHACTSVDMNIRIHEHAMPARYIVQESGSAVDTEVNRACKTFYRSPAVCFKVRYSYLQLSLHATESQMASQAGHKQAPTGTTDSGATRMSSSQRRTV